LISQSRGLGDVYKRQAQVYKKETVLIDKLKLKELVKN
jgi:hypothetical protein